MSRVAPLHVVRPAVAIREAAPHEVAGWDEIVARFDNARLFHRRAWTAHVAAFSGARPLYLIFERAGEIVGCLPGFLTTVALVRMFVSPREGWQSGSMGPAFDPERLSTADISGALVEYLERRYGVVHIEFISGPLDTTEMAARGFHATPLFTYRAPLTPGDEARTLASIKAKTRNQLRKAIKLGLVATVESGDAFVDEFYDQAREVFARRGNAVPFSRQRAHTLVRHMRAAGTLLAIAVRLPDGGPCIATGIFLVDGRELYLWNWTHRTAYRSHCPTELLTWTAMQHAMAAGCTTFDLAGGGDAKEKFGAVPETARFRWTRSRYPWLGAIRTAARRAYRWQQAVRGRVVRRQVFGADPAA